MAFRLSDAVVCGELINTRRNSVHGWLGLRGMERPLSLQLTGNCSPDLAGRHIRFELRNMPPEQSDSPESEAEEKQRLEELGVAGLAWQQIGPTGTMTADYQVKTSDCPPAELDLRCEPGEPPPAERQRRLYLEWFSQNGQVVVELVDPIIEFVAPDEPDAPLEFDEPPAECGVPADADSEACGQESEAEAMPFADDEEDDDGYHLIPDELQRQFDAQARETDRALHGEESDELRESRLMDELIARGEGEPLGSLFDDPVRLPRPETLDDEAVEAQLKRLLALLALYGVAFSMCEHFTPRDAYSLLVGDLCKEGSAFRELRGTQWVQWFDSSEACPLCQEALDREYEERQSRERKDSPPGEEAAGNDEP